MNRYIQRSTVELLEKTIKELLSTSKDKITERDRYVIAQIVETIQDKLFIYTNK
jgi:hypothetical protein